MFHVKQFYNKISEILELNTIKLSESQIFLLDIYLQSLLDINLNINLISRKETDNILEKHFVPCLVFSNYLSKFENNFLDIGTGGGFPGILLGILHSNSNGLLIDSIQKKIFAVNSIIDKLSMKNIRCCCTRAEDKYFQNKYKEYFNLIVSRSTAELSILVRYSKYLLKKNKSSCILTLKGGDLTNEILSAKKIFPDIIITQFPMPYLPENKNNINSKYIIKVENIN